MFFLRILSRNDYYCGEKKTKIPLQYCIFHIFFVLLCEIAINTIIVKKIILHTYLSN